MRRLGFLAMSLLSLATVAQAQNPTGVPRLPAAAERATTPNDPQTYMSLGELTPTPSMWLYEQERRKYEDPKNSVRANAEFRGTQRRKRIAAMQWFGYSNARPMYSSTPNTSTASPQWGSNSSDPYLWSGVGRPTVVFAPDTGAYVR